MRLACSLTHCVLCVGPVDLRFLPVYSDFGHFVLRYAAIRIFAFVVLIG